ncbi:MAG: hypothetical protein ACI8PZ_000595 [Myxococcota bacterium]|jgi:hypothetical protein
MAGGGSNVAMGGFALLNLVLLGVGFTNDPGYVNCASNVVTHTLAGKAANTACLTEWFHVPGWCQFMNVVNPMGHTPIADLSLAVVAVLGMVVLMFGRGSSS